MDISSNKRKTKTIKRKENNRNNNNDNDNDEERSRSRNDTAGTVQADEFDSENINVVIDNTKGKTSGSKSFDLGLDISTSVIGICVIGTKGEAIEILDGIKITSTKLRNLWEKADRGIEEIENRLLAAEIHFSDIKRIYVESAAKRFSFGLSSADTIFTLAKFNALISYLIYKKTNIVPKEINVSSARKAIGFKNIDKSDKKPIKDKVFEFNLKNHPDFPWKTHVAKTGKKKGEVVYDVENKDASDAYVILSGGRKIDP